MNYAIQLENVNYAVESREILKDINLAVREGVFLGIVGPNGGGKTTLLKIILGILKANSGTAKVFEVAPAELRGTGKIGYLPQHTNIDPNFPATAMDVVLMGRYKSGKIFYDKGDRESAERCLDLMGILSKKNKPFGSLSGGEQQRVSIARAFVSNPRLLILDEPSTGIDAVGQENFYAFLRDLREKQSITIIMVSHDIGAIDIYVDDMACLNNVIHYHGRPSDITGPEIFRRLYGKDVELIRHNHECDTCERVK
jgi:zinc transport system ATP-binding protein